MQQNAEVEKQTKLLTSSYEALVVKNKQSNLFGKTIRRFLKVHIPYRSNCSTQHPMKILWEMLPWFRPEFVRVTGKGEVTLEMNFQSMQFAGMTGYLYKLKKGRYGIRVEYNKYNYPVKYEAF